MAGLDEIVPKSKRVPRITKSKQSPSAVPEKQDKKQFDWLTPWQFQKGQSGNPNGRPPGKSLKTFAREYLESLTGEEKIEYLKTLPTEIVWKMAEGNPDNKSDIDVTSGGEPMGVVILPQKNENPLGTPTEAS